MPNHVTNKIKASEKVIASMLNEEGQVDFDVIIPRHKDLEMNGCTGIRGDAETAAESVCGEPESNHPLLAGLQRQSRSNVNVLKMDDDSFEQFVMMIRNKRKHGFYHMMDFARIAWGTKWNAYDQGVEKDFVQFDTAWSHPEPVIKALSESHPDEVIEVEYADEDTGSNCGKYTIKGGVIIMQSIAPDWSEQTAKEKSEWTEFAIKLKYGDDAKPEDFDRDENWNYVEDEE